MIVVGVHRWCTQTPFRTPRSFACQKNPRPQNAQAQAGAVWSAERDGELGALTDPDSWGLRRVSRADAGHSRYIALRGTSGRAGLRVLDSQSRTKVRLAAGQATHASFRSGRSQSEGCPAHRRGAHPQC